MSARQDRNRRIVDARAAARNSRNNASTGTGKGCRFLALVVVASVPTLIAIVSIGVGFLYGAVSH